MLSCEALRLPNLPRTTSRPAFMPVARSNAPKVSSSSSSVSKSSTTTCGRRRRNRSSPRSASSASRILTPRRSSANRRTSRLSAEGSTISTLGESWTHPVTGTAGAEGDIRRAWRGKGSRGANIRVRSFSGRRRTSCTAGDENTDTVRVCQNRFAPVSLPRDNRVLIDC